MAGFYAVADSSEPVRTDLDNELEGKRRVICHEVPSLNTATHRRAMVFTGGSAIRVGTFGGHEIRKTSTEVGLRHGGAAR